MTLRIVDSDVISTPTHHRQRPLRRDLVERITPECFAICSGIGLARRWHEAARCALQGLRDAYRSQERDEAERLRVCFGAARADLVAAHRQTIERVTFDAMLLVLSFRQTELNVGAVGNARVYLHRDGVPKRITSKTPDANGITTAMPDFSRAELRVGDVVLAGTHEVFSVRVVGKVAASLGEGANPPVSTLTGIISDGARDHGLGAAAAVIRVG